MSYLDNQDYYVYQLRLETSEEPFYIGKGRKNRINKHFTKDSLSYGTYKDKIIIKAIKNNVNICREFLHKDLLEEVALCIEQQYIEFYGRVDNNTGILANHTDGGDGQSLSEISLTKLSISLQSRSFEDKQKTKIKKQTTIKNRTPEEKLLISKNRSEGHKNRPPELEQARIKKRLDTISKKSDEEKAESEKKFQKSIIRRTLEEKLATQLKRKATLDKIPKEIRQQAYIARSERWKNLSQEQIKQRSLNISIARKLLNIPPWEHSSCNSFDKLSVWESAIDLYILYKNGHNTRSKIAKIMGSNNPDLFQAIVRKFNSGWNPMEDEKWISRFKTD